jgi:hypothetical protein
LVRPARIGEPVPLPGRDHQAGMQIELDFHPTNAGHSFIAQRFAEVWKALL